MATRSKQLSSINLRVRTRCKGRQPFSKGVKLSPCVFFDMITHASGPTEGHPRWIVFVHRGEKYVYDCRFFRSAERLQVDSQHKGRRQPEIRESGIYHDIGKESFTVGFIVCEQAADIIQILHSPLWIVHEGDNLQKQQRGRRNYLQREIWRKLKQLLLYLREIALAEPGKFGQFAYGPVSGIFRSGESE